MKKKFDSKFKLGKKNTILLIVALALVLTTVIGTSFSWIEEVSQVEFNSTSGQQTPLHVGSKVLKAEAVMKDNPTNAEINLSDYFYESGGMHLSPCYGDGDNFYFPIWKKSRTDSNLLYRTGTKDDANVNYLSATFRVKSDNANTSYWFEKVDSSTDFVSFKNSSGSNISGTTLNALKECLRISVTVDGTTNVYAYNSGGTYSTIEANAVASKTGRSLAKYMYYEEEPDNTTPVNCYRNSTNGNVTNKPNQGGYDGTHAETKNLDGSTLFTVNKYDTENKKGAKDVTVKIWLEYNNSGVRNIKVSNINLKLTSSWEKIRRVYVKDDTIAQQNRNEPNWLGKWSSTLHWALKDDLANKHWALTRVSSSSNIYYYDIPAVYNGSDVVLFRCGSSWNSGSDTSYTSGSTTINCRDYWVTKLPNTFHSEVFTVYSSDFGTWNEAETNSIYIVNSTDFNDMYDYMWDSNSVHGNGINDKVVKNAEWPGIKMKTQTLAKTSSQSLQPYAFFYNADYDRIIFNDGDIEENKNHEYQTQDLWLTPTEVNCTFDMATLTWFHTNPNQNDWSTKMPSYSASNTYLYTNIATDNKWKRTRFAYDGEYDTSSYGDNAFKNTSTTNMLCKIYNKAGTTSTLSDYECQLCYNGTWYGAYKNSDHRLYAGNSYTLSNDSDKENLILEDLKGKTVYRVYLSFDNGRPKLSLSEGEALPQT